MQDTVLPFYSCILHCPNGTQDSAKFNPLPAHNLPDLLGLLVVTPTIFVGCLCGAVVPETSWRQQAWCLQGACT